MPLPKILLVFTDSLITNFGTHSQKSNSQTKVHVFACDTMILLSKPCSVLQFRPTSWKAREEHKFLGNESGKKSEYPGCRKGFKWNKQLVLVQCKFHTFLRGKRLVVQRELLFSANLEIPQGREAPCIVRCLHSHPRCERLICAAGFSNEQMLPGFPRKNSSCQCVLCGSSDNLICLCT